VTDWERLEREDAVATARLWRRVFHWATVASLLVVVSPLVLPSVDWLGPLGAAGVAVLLGLAPWWIWPIALSSRRGLVRDGDRVTALTVRGERTIDLAQVDRVRTVVVLGSEFGDNAFARLSGPGQRSLVLTWGSLDEPEGSTALTTVQEVLARPGVSAAPRTYREAKLASREGSRAGDVAAHVAVAALLAVVLVAAVGVYATLVLGYR
jgi:hypothetical protein